MCVRACVCVCACRSVCVSGCLHRAAIPTILYSCGPNRRQTRFGLGPRVSTRVLRRIGFAVPSTPVQSQRSLQAVAALSIALVSMGEELGADMSIRQFDHMLQV